MRGICGRISGGSKGKCKTSTGLTKGRVLSPSAQRDRGYVTEIKSNRRREVMRSYSVSFVRSEGKSLNAMMQLNYPATVYL
jgi:hypothetical protein